MEYNLGKYWIAMWYIWNENNIINQLYFNENKRIKVIEGIKAASQLTLTWEVVLDCLAGSVSSQKPFKWRRRQERVSEGCDSGKSHLAIAGFEDGKEPGAKNAG